MNNIFKVVTVRIDFDNTKYIKWCMDDNFVLKAGESFSVFKSKDGGNTWDELATDIEGNTYTDTVSENLNVDERSYYKVAHVSGGVRVYSVPVQEGFAPANTRDFLYIREMVRKETLMLVQYTGTKGFLLQKKTYGTVCPDCVDQETGGIIDANCSTCAGTGLIGGFYPAIPLYLAIIKPSDHTKEVEGQVGGAEMGAMIVGTTVAHPWIDSGDIWVNNFTNERYEVDKVKPKADYKGRVLTYTLVLLKEDKSPINVIYKDIITDNIEAAVVEYPQLY